MGLNHSKEERFKKITISNSRPRTGTVQKIFEKVFKKSKADAEFLQSDASATIFPCSSKSPIIPTTADTNDVPRTQLMERQSTSNNSTINNISPKLFSFDYTGRLQTFDENGREMVDENDNILLSNPNCSSSLECNATQSSILSMHSCYTNGIDDAAFRSVILQRNPSSSISFNATPFWGKTMYQGNNMAVYNVETSNTNTTGASKSTKESKVLRRKITPRIHNGNGSVPGNNAKGKKVHSQGNKKVENSKGEIKKNPDKSEKVRKTGCCKPVAPPVFFEAFNRSSDTNNFGRGNSCNPADRLKNVDVVEELLYYVPAPDICNDSDDDNEFDYYCINECGDMELVPRAPKESPKNCSFNPVKYSRRQRFNFKDSRDSDEPPFPWLGPQTKSCCCQCCKAGLRRNPNCCCGCCAMKGVARVSNSFDEIPVGKNPQIQAKNFDAPCTPKSEDESTSSSEESSENCQDVLPIESGLYFYDANRQRFVRQEPPLTPEPICVTNMEPPPPPPPPKKKPTIQPVVQPVVMQPPCPPPPCPPKPCCCENSCNCKCNKETPPPTFVPVMMCGGYNGGNSRCPPGYCSGRPRCCMPPPCGPPCYPNPYQNPYQGPPQNDAQNSPSQHSSNTGERSEEHSTESEGTPTGSGSLDEETITASVTRHENSTITSIIVPPGQKGEINITS